MTTLEGWIEAIALTPKDTLTWDAAADWCEENGRLDRAMTLRHPFLRRRCPGLDNAMSLVREVRSFDWGELNLRYRIFKNHLPLEVLDRLEPIGPVDKNWRSIRCREYYSVVDAYKALLVVALELPPSTFDLPEGVVLDYR